MKQVKSKKHYCAKLVRRSIASAMIRDGDRVARGASGGKDSLTMLVSAPMSRERAPIDFSVCAFTVEQGKFLRPIEPLGAYLRSAASTGPTTTTGRPSVSSKNSPTWMRPVQPLPAQGGHLRCARTSRQRHRLRPYRRRFLRVAAAEHAVHRPSQRAASHHLVARQGVPPDPAAGVCDEEITTAFGGLARRAGNPLRMLAETGTVRRSLRDIFRELERDHPI